MQQLPILLHNDVIVHEFPQTTPELQQLDHLAVIRFEDHYTHTNGTTTRNECII